MSPSARKYVYAVRPELRPLGLLVAVYFGSVLLFVVLKEGLLLRLAPSVLPDLAVQPGATVMGTALFEAGQALVLVLVLVMGGRALLDRGLFRFRTKVLATGLVAGLAFQCVDYRGIEDLKMLGAGLLGRLSSNVQGPYLALSALIFLVFYAVVAPLLEETFFRGMLQSSFERHFGVVASILLTAVAFSLVHWDQHNLALDIYSLFIGILFSAVRKREGTLAFPIACHVAFNLVAGLEILAHVGSWPVDLRLLVLR